MLCAHTKNATVDLVACDFVECSFISLRQAVCLPYLESFQLALPS